MQLPPLELLSVGILLLHLVMQADPLRRWRAVPRLPKADGRPGGAGFKTVVAVVPARDEAVVLPRTLPPLLAQTRVVLVDDGSTDGTAEAARRVAEEERATERFTLLPAPPRPEGWSGKLHALHHGVAAVLRSAEVSGEEPPTWFLFTDADIEHRPGSVTSLLTQAETGVGKCGADLLSVMARLRAVTFWERLLIPPFVYFFHFLYPFRRVSLADSSVAAAAGGCVLLRRQALEAIGGWPALKGAIIDDVTLAQRVRGAGGQLWLGLDPGITSVRSYTFGDLWNMVARTAFTQLRHRWSLLWLTLLSLGAVYLAPPGLLVLHLLEGQWIGTTAAAVATLVPMLALLPWVRYHRVPPLYAATFPLAALLYGAMTWTSAWRHLRGRGARWKGRSYR